MKVNHIGYLVKDIEKSILEFKNLGYIQESCIFVDNLEEGGSCRNVKICFLNNETTRVELVSPIEESSDIYSTIKRQGEGPYHICYSVTDLEEKIHALKSSGWIVLRRPAKAVAFANSRVVFMFKNGVGMIELVEDKGCF